MAAGARNTRKGFVVIELLVVVAVIAVLLGLGYSVYRGARLSARVATAESNLKQVGAALDMFFQKYGSYPPQGANLVAVLAPYVRDTALFGNPLKEEAAPGETLSGLYVEPDLKSLDSPNHYITALISSDGTVAVVLKTGGAVERRDGLQLPADDLAGAGAQLAVLWNGYGSQPSTGTGGDTPPAGDNPPAGDVLGGDLGGDININPNNNDNFEFELTTATVLPDGTLKVITRDELLGSKGSLTYKGLVVKLIFKPKGNGNQNTLTLNGKVYDLENKNRYLIVTLAGGSMTVNLFNSKAGKGNAMGKWWMSIDAKGVDISVCKCGAESAAACTCGK